MANKVSYRRVDYEGYLESGGHHGKQTISTEMLFYLAESKGVVLGEIVFSKPRSIWAPITPGRFENSSQWVSIFIHQLDAYPRGIGIGGNLVRRVEEEARSEGIERISLNSENHRFWAAMGYDLPEGLQRVKRAVKLLVQKPEPYLLLDNQQYAAR